MMNDKGVTENDDGTLEMDNSENVDKNDNELMGGSLLGARNAKVLSANEGLSKVVGGQAQGGPQAAIRRSERFKKDINLTTQEKAEILSKKRNLEGLYPGGEKEKLEEGVQMMLKIATDILGTKTWGGDNARQD